MNTSFMKFNPDRYPNITNLSQLIQNQMENNSNEIWIKTIPPPILNAIEVPSINQTNHVEVKEAIDYLLIEPNYFYNNIHGNFDIAPQGYEFVNYFHHSLFSNGRYNTYYLNKYASRYSPTLYIIYAAKHNNRRILNENFVSNPDTQSYEFKKQIADDMAFQNIYPYYHSLGILHNVYTSYLACIFANDYAMVLKMVNDNLTLSKSELESIIPMITYKYSGSVDIAHKHISLLIKDIVPHGGLSVEVTFEAIKQDNLHIFLLLFPKVSPNFYIIYMMVEYGANKIFSKCNNHDLNYEIINRIISLNRVNMVESLVTRNFKFTQQHMMVAIDNTRYNIVKLMHESGVTISINHCITAFINVHRNVNMIKYLIHNYRGKSYRSLLKTLAQRDTHHELNMLHNYGIKFNNMTSLINHKCDIYKIYKKYTPPSKFPIISWSPSDDKLIRLLYEIGMRHIPKPIKLSISFPGSIGGKRMYSYIMEKNGHMDKVRKLEKELNK